MAGLSEVELPLIEEQVRQRHKSFVAEFGREYRMTLISVRETPSRIGIGG
jgi:hypothetical protein